MLGEPIITFIYTTWETISKARLRRANVNGDEVVASTRSTEWSRALPSGRKHYRVDASTTDWSRALGLPSGREHYRTVIISLLE